MSEVQKNKAKRIIEILKENQTIILESKTGCFGTFISIREYTFEDALTKAIAQAEGPIFAIGAKVKIFGFKDGVKHGEVVAHSVGYDPLLYRVEDERNIRLRYWLEAGRLELE